jgi:hypothetical protein
MSLEDLRRQVEEEESAEDQPKVEVEEAVAVEPEDETQSEGDESEETNDDFDFEIDGEEPKQDKPTPEQAMLYKLTKKSKKLSEAKSENEQLREEIEALKAGMVTQKPQPKPQQQRPTPILPDLYEDFNGDRAKYSQAINEYFNQVNQQNQNAVQAQQQTLKQKQVEQDRAVRLAKRSADFITASKLNEDKATDFIQCGIESLDTLTGINGGGLYLLDSVGEDSEKLAYYLGKNPAELNRIKEWLEEDSTGLKAIANMTRIVTQKLKPKTSKSTKTLEPDEPLTGSTSTKNAGELQRKYDDAISRGQMDKIMAIRSEARSKGVQLN